MPICKPWSFFLGQLGINTIIFEVNIMAIEIGAGISMGGGISVIPEPAAPVNTIAPVVSGTATYGS
jgi:hypothetical protein